MCRWFCWGTTHFCQACHTLQAKNKSVPVKRCPGLAACPLKIRHENGEEQSLGCEACKLLSVEY